MPHFDLPLDQLREYRPCVAEPDDFDTFWSDTLAETQRFPLDAVFSPVHDELWRNVRVWDASFNGYAGQRIRGWLLATPTADNPLPCWVSFVGYGGGRGLPVDHLAPVAAGFAHFVMDTRGQGAGWSAGETPDDAPSGPRHPGFMTAGIESPATYYYRRLFVDAVRAVEAATTHESVDAARIAVHGSSQGGGVAIAAAALASDHVRLLLADVPFLCHFERAVTITDALPYAEIARYLRVHRGRAADVRRVLSYFDGVNFARRVRCPALLSVGMMDTICPPSTVFAAYNALPAEKDIRVYEFNEHDGGGSVQTIEKLRMAIRHFC